MKPVPDVIDFSLKILFIGFNPGIRSSETGHHFAGPSNRFWRLLHDSRLTDIKLAPDEDRVLLNYGYGITNIVPRPTRAAAELTKEEYEAGRKILKHKLETYRPKIACYVGIGVYSQFSKLKKVSCGLQTDSIVEGVQDFVVSSSSGLNRIPLEQQIAFFIELKELIANS